MGKVYRRCLQVHPDKVDIRISSARYELDLAMADERSDASAAADSGLRVENARFVVSTLYISIERGYLSLVVARTTDFKSMVRFQNQWFTLTHWGPGTTT